MARMRVAIAAVMAAGVLTVASPAVAATVGTARATPTIAARSAAQPRALTPVPSPVPFADVPSDAAFAAEIQWLSAQGISTGWVENDGSRTFRPLSPVNRDAMAAFMYRFAGAPDFSPPPVSPLVDVQPTDMFFKAIIWITARQISTGWDDGNGGRSYRPGQPVNRDAMAAFMYRLADRPAFSPPAVSPFSDVSTDNIYYHEITWLAAQGISTGWVEADGTRTFRPLQPVNRDAMAAFMYRFSARPASG